MQKFIVTSGGLLKFGDVTMHKDLLSPGEECIGGGMYEFDHAGGRMFLWGKSYDFGRVKWSWIDELRIPASLSGLRLLYEDMPLGDFVNCIFEDLTQHEKDKG